MAPPLIGTLIDDFNRSNGAIGDSYTVLVGGLNVASNVVAGTSTNNMAAYDIATLPADCEAVLTVTTLQTTGGQAVRLFLRTSTISLTSNSYQLAVARSDTTYSWYLYRVTGGAPTQLGSTVTGQTLTAGDKIAFQIVGSTLKGYRYTSGAWSEVITATDATYTAAGYLMFGVDSTTGRIDDLYGGPASLDLTPSEATQAHSADAPGATFEAGGGGTVDVTPSEATQAHTADAPGATPIYVLTPSKATQAHTADAPTAHPPITSVKLGIIGDSGLDEYRADDARGGSYGSVTFSAGEMLVRVLSWNLGTWSTRSEPRRTGYAQNWARSACTAGSVHNGGGTSAVAYGQHTGLAAQVTAGDVDTAVVWLGVNDYALHNDTYQDIYDGTIAGTDLQDKIDSILANIETIVDALITAGCNRILVSNIYDIGPGIAASYPNATFRARVTAAINTTNTGIDAIIAARSECELSDRAGIFDDIYADYPPDGNGAITIGGEVIAATAGDEPHHYVLTDGHPGTVYSALMANYGIIDALNDGFGLSLARMSDAEILAEIGITTYEATPSEATQAHSADAPAAAFIIARTPGEATQTHTADVPTARAVTAVTPAEASQAHSSDSPQARAVYVTTPTDAAQAHTSDTPTARAIYLLTPSDAAQAHSSDAPAVSFQAPGASVTPAKATQQHTSDAANAHALYLLTPAEANQGHTADSPTATYQAPGAYADPSEASQSHSADSPTARAIYRLTAGEAAQTHTSDAPGVTAIQPTAQATPGEAVQAHSADSPAVYAVYAVTPGRSTQAHTADSPAASILLAVTAIVALTVLIRDGRLQVRGRDDGLTVGPRATALEVKSK